MPVSVETRNLFENVALGATVPVLGLELVSLLSSGAVDHRDACLLDEAIAAGEASVDEVTESGVVGRVRVLHRGKLPLLVLQGEQLLGAKQNRTFNASFVIAPGKEVVLPVSCVEQGRWVRQSREFRPGTSTLAPSVRSRHLRRVTETMAQSASYDGNQHAVWSDVREYMEATGVRSVTGAYQDAERSRTEAVERAVSTLSPEPGQIGLAVVRAGRVVMLDLFGSPALFARAFARCVRGALADVALGAEPAAAAEPAAELVRRALAELVRSDPARTVSPADGETLSARAGNVTYAAAVYDGAIYHCAAAG